MMPDIPTQAETVRRRMLQPAVDLLFVHARINCFLVATGLVVAHMALMVASGLHQAMVGSWSSWNLLLDLPVFVLLGMLARHLVRFQARAGRTGFRVVHPFFRPWEVASYLMTALVPVLGTLQVAVDYAQRHSVGSACWEALTQAGMFILFLAGYVASCEWRRLPPARRRERSGPAALAADPA